jgi:DNA (cytosine-5)-methyltransferase 1
VNELALFAGIGGGLLAGHWLGWRVVCAVEVDPYAASVLVARQNDGLLPPFPVWDDVRTFDGRPWRGRVDVVSGGFPCQDISKIGSGAGLDGARSGLWREFARVVGEVRPGFVFVENSPALLVRGLGRLLADLARLGYRCRWRVLGAADVGAPHERNRIWIVADLEGGAALPDADRAGLPQREGIGRDDGEELPAAVGARWWAVEPDVGRVADGFPSRVERIRALGNGQVPACAVEAWRSLTQSRA